MFTRHHNIPEEAQCVFTWVRSEVFQWNQDMYDGSIALFERVRFLDGAFVIGIEQDGRILVTRQSQPQRHDFLSLPGWSFAFPEEDPVDCARRELLEETWYTTSEDIIPWIRFDGTVNVMTYTYFYIARNCKKIQEITPDSGEKISVFSVTFDEFLELSSDVGFHHHWNLLPIFYEARLSPEKKEELRIIFFGK